MFQTNIKIYDEPENEAKSIMDKKIIFKKISALRKMTNLEAIKMDLYGVVAALILSKEDFPTNIAITPFLNELGIDCDPYLLKSRISIIGRAIEYIEKADGDQIELILDALKGKVQPVEGSHHKKPRKNVKKENYMATLIKKYGRDSQD